MSALARTQRLFFEALLVPLSGENRALAELPPGAAAPSDGFCALADALLRSTPEVGARERLSLYHRQYWWRLLDSLAEDFPRVRTLLGAESFRSTLERYLRAYPPSSWTLRHLGADFAAFLREDPETAPSLRPWASALAAYEYAHMRVFEAALLPTPEDADLATHPLTLQPGVALVPVDRPISRLLRPDADPRLATNEAPGRELHVVWRTSGHALRARREPVSLLPLLSALRHGGILAEIIARGRPLPRPALIETAFARWRSLGWLALAS